MTIKVRIVKRTYPDGDVKYIIQRLRKVMRRGIFGKDKYAWFDAHAYYNDGMDAKYINDTLEEAQVNLCWFDGSETIDEVIK